VTPKPATIHFDHEKLDVYQVALEFVRFASTLCERLDGRGRHARDQLIRASLSLPLNIAEGNGKRSRPDRKRFFEIARGSTFECAAVLDVLKITGATGGDELNEGKCHLIRVASMLTRMTERDESGVREADPGYGTESEMIDYDYPPEEDTSTSTKNPATRAIAGGRF